MVILETDVYRFQRISEQCSGSAVIYISNDGFGNAGETIYKNLLAENETPFPFYELVVKNWDHYLTPWKAEAIFKGRVFEGQAAILLGSLKTDMIPEIRKHNIFSQLFIAGYSLAGLFALWSLYECDLFDGAACCSGSLWYPGWNEYASSHSLKKKSRVYLSLGKREKKTKNPIMKNVESGMLRQYELLQQDDNLERSHINWHDGGHFDNTDKRTEMGIRWLLK